MKIFKGISKPLFLIILFLLFPAVSFLPAQASAEISKIVFTTDVQTIKPNTLSGPITIQTQDSSGNVYQTPETLDIQFISTSATGQFLGSTGNPATTYMSKNTANKTFYYKDSVEGNFTITINVRGRDSGAELDTSQQITISSGAVQSSSSNSSNSSDNSGGSEESSGASSLTNVSTQGEKLEISAGEDRTTSPGSPIWFQATAKKNTSLTSSELSWSFGDGNVGVGPLVSHTYKYAGDYVVVLSARAGDVFSVSRLKVKVGTPEILVLDKGEYLEISNNSNSEINLFNWKIENKGKGFVFQPNTIILPQSSIKLDKNLLKMKGLDNSFGTSLKNSFGQEVFALAPVKEVDLTEASKKLENIKNEFSLIQEKTKNLALVLPTNNFNSQSVNVLSAVSADESNIATSTENIIYEAPKSEGLFTKLTNFIKRVFSK